MLLATILLLGALPQSAGVARSVANATLEATAGTKDSGTRNLPSAPTPKPEADGQGVSASLVSADAVQPPRLATPIRPVKSAYPRPQETQKQRLAWYALAVTAHGAAAFDAYTTRLAISGGYGTEGNPLLRPFSHSNALYAATQASPVVLDYIGKRMMLSENRWVRRLWWVPQAAGSGISVGAGVHNLGVVK